MDYNMKMAIMQITYTVSLNHPLHFLSYYSIQIAAQLFPHRNKIDKVQPILDNTLTTKHWVENNESNISEKTVHHDIDKNGGLLDAFIGMPVTIQQTHGLLIAQKMLDQQCYLNL